MNEKEVQDDSDPTIAEIEDPKIEEKKPPNEKIIKYKILKLE